MQWFVRYEYINKKLEWAFLGLLTICNLVIRGILSYNAILYRGDQAYHGGFINAIAQGQPVYYGSSNSYTDWFLYPLHYYFNAIFSIFSQNPIYHITANLLIGSLTPVLVYYFLRETNRHLKYGYILNFFITGFFSISFFSVFLSTFEWNPNTLLFFTLLGVLSVYKITEDENNESLRAPEKSKKESTKATAKVSSKQGVKNTFQLYLSNFRNHRNTIFWPFLLGFSVIMLGSLHATGLFVGAICTILFIIFLVLKQKYVQLGVLIASMTLFQLPYLAGEVIYGFYNSRLIILFAFKGSEFTLQDRFMQAYFTLILWINNVFFSKADEIFASFFAAFIAIFPVFRFNKIHPLHQLYFFVCAVYLVVVSGYTLPIHWFYKGIIQFFPFLSLYYLILFTISRLSPFVTKIRQGYHRFLQPSYLARFGQLIALSSVILILVGYGVIYNLRLNKVLYYINYNPENRMLSIRDKEAILKKYDGSSFCFYEGPPYFNSLRLLNQSVVQSNISFYPTESDLKHVAKPFNYELSYRFCPVGSLILQEKNIYTNQSAISGSGYELDINVKTSTGLPINATLEEVEDSALYKVYRIVSVDTETLDNRIKYNNK